MWAMKLMSVAMVSKIRRCRMGIHFAIIIVRLAGIKKYEEMMR